MGTRTGSRHFTACAWRSGALALALLLGACGLGRDPETESGAIRDPVVAARVNGRPIYIEDVRSYAVQRGFLQEGEDLDANSDAFYFALEELIEVRLFALEGEARGLDRDPDVRRRLESARERVLANAIYEDLQQSAVNPEAIERLYRENASRLGQGQEVHLRHIQFETEETAEAARRRLDAGEAFEALAFELSTDRNTAADGGDLQFRAVGDLAPAIRTIAEQTNVGQVAGPVQIDSFWHLIKVEDRRERGVPSLETLRPQIVQWLMFEETQRLRDRLERDARIERLREPDTSNEPAGDAEAPAAAPEVDVDGEIVATPARPGQREPPPFPFPMGPGGVFGDPNASAPAAPPPTATATPGPSPTEPARAAEQPSPASP